MNDPIVSTVGRDSGRLVLHLEHVVPQSPDDVQRALRLALTLPSDNDVTGDGRINLNPAVIGWASDNETVRWEVSGAGDGSRLAVTTWTDSDDVDAVAMADADHHARFERLARQLDTGCPAPPFRCAYFAGLATRYRAAVAAALADTD